jgi:quercetin dioxygenase-like cupin family protein
MSPISITTLLGEHLVAARTASSGRSAHTVYGGHQHALRQTLIALARGRRLDEHESPGEATLHVLHGRVRLEAGSSSCEAAAGDIVVIPEARHALEALDDAAVLLTVTKR